MGDPVIANGMAPRAATCIHPRKVPSRRFHQPAKQVTFEKTGKVFNAISGDRIVVEKGKIPSNLAINTANPRTAIDE